MLPRVAVDVSTQVRHGAAHVALHRSSVTLGAPPTVANVTSLTSGVVTKPGSSAEPAQFRAAIEAMHRAVVHPAIEIGPIRPPQRLAPFSYAIGAEVSQPTSVTNDGDTAEQSDGDAFGRLILLHDPDGDEAWNGTMRLVAYIQADVDETLASDPLLPEVGWSWLVDALSGRGEPFTALGGTVTSTSSVRYGDIAGPPKAHQLELRASWTAGSIELSSHVEAFCEVLAYAAGLPPAGITELRAAEKNRT